MPGMTGLSAEPSKGTVTEARSLEATIGQGGDNKPVLAVAVSERIVKRGKGVKPKISFKDDDAAQERAERKLERHYYPFEKVLNEATGMTDWCLNWHVPAWSVNGHEFDIARYYPHARVAFDFADSVEDEIEAPDRKKVLNALGIVHVFLALDAEMNVEQIKTEIARQRAEVQSGPNS